ncbi:MAG TPA: phosphoribosylanthranilate isomerase [Acidimicrobiia bacterium]|jgi:phosphoribosylanthranilate isomerase|nr:phosphoribosylanthranilate isomerase [Acidimicrobiia bacterium]
MFVKICGITNEDDALLATAVDADALGFVLAPSPRQVHPEVVRDIVRRLPREVHTIGVFRNERPERIIEIVGRSGLRGVQLHGAEPASEVAWIRERVQFVIQAFSAGDPALASARKSAADIILIDSPTPGSGKVFDWQLAEGAPVGKRILLAGGLTPENVGDAIRLVRPWGVDVSTGVEQTRGRKDPVKLRQFVAAAREAAAADGADAHAYGAIDLTADEEAGRTRPWDWQIDQ